MGQCPHPKHYLDPTESEQHSECNFPFFLIDVDLKIPALENKKNFGRKFGLAKFCFGLIKFVCVMLLITAKLNNNNTEFLWVVGGWVRIP